MAELDQENKLKIKWENIRLELREITSIEDIEKMRLKIQDLHNKMLNTTLKFLKFFWSDKK